MPNSDAVIYEVELFVDGEIADDFLDWLREHVLQLLQLEGFVDASIERRERLDEDSEVDQARFCVRYELRDREAFERYLREDAERFRGDAMERFANRFHAERSLLTGAAAKEGIDSLYARLETTTKSLLSDERDALANMANFAALIWSELPRINWAGFYLLRAEELVLGPFQGKTACVRIPMGSGICGTAAACREALVVADVHEFEGHIACDAASRSEIVLPILHAGSLIGVLDIDSPLPDRFDARDRAGLEKSLAAMVAATDWETLQLESAS